MTDRSRGLARFGWLAVFLAPPAVTTALWLKYILDYPLFAALLIALYEICVLVVRFTAGVASDLAVRWQKRLADHVDRALRHRVSRFGRQYQKFVLASLRFIDLRGLATVGPFTPELDEVFVDVSVTPRPPHLVQTGLIADPLPLSDERRALHDFLDGRKPARLAVVGAPGSGKTTLLRHTARHVYTPHPQRRHRRIHVPILLYLRDHASVISGNPDVTLTDLLRSTLGRLRAAEPDGWFEQRLHDGECIVLLDGLDEVARQDDRKSVAGWVGRQIRQFPANDYVITSRPQGYWATEIEGASVLQVRSFAAGQVERFVQGWYLAMERHSTGADGPDITERARSAADDLLKRLDGAPALYDLGANPLLLTMIANVHRYRGALPGRRVELYHEICQVMLWRRQEAKQLPTGLDGDKKEAVLCWLAYAMMQRKVRDLPHADLCAEITPALERLPQHVAAEAFLTDVVSNGLLVERESGLFCFAHLTFQEYLAAEHIREKGLAGELCKVIGDPWWRETILLYAARADADPIIKECLRQGSMAALALAFDCADQGSQFASGLRDQLESILAAGPDLTGPSRTSTSLERFFLITGIRLTRHLHQQLRASKDTRLCARPITADLYQLFQVHRRLTTPAGWVQATIPQPAFVMDPADATAFATWVNTIIGGEPSYRLPSRAALDDPAVQRLLTATTGNRPVHCAWIKPDHTDTPALWVPDGARHPHQITDATLISSISDDVKHATPALLIELLVLRSAVLTHTLLRSVLGSDHAQHPRRNSRPAPTSNGMPAHDRNLTESLFQHLQLAHELDRNPESWLGHARQQASELDAMDNAAGEAPAIVAKLSHDLLRTIRAGRAVQRARHLGFRLWLSYDPVNLGDFISAEDVETNCSLLMGQALSQALLAAASEPTSAKDCTAKFSGAFIKAAGITEQHYFVPPHTLRQMLTGTVHALKRTQNPPGQAGAHTWADSVADCLQMTAEPVFERREPLTPSLATSIRLTALCLAAEADAHIPGRHGERLRRIAAGVTLLQRRINGDDPPVEMIMLATD